ncbi:MAG: hypothetical protein K2G64_07240 [Muribaculaceae bacterium]|nr:hypothetical protein [Muribaculaceae bacterium]MDE5968884.1 hypothetical protein [Muribaculaceae bacterium]
MLPEEIIEYCKNNLSDVCTVESWGETGIFYNPDNRFKRGTYVLTLKNKDGDNDKSSDLNREGVFRLNFGVKKETFIRLFGNIPSRPPKGGIVDMNFDYTKRNTLIPHPVYGWMSWVSILNPSPECFETTLKPLIKESYCLAVQKAKKRK